MSFDRNNSVQRDESGRLMGQPHPDCRENLAYACARINKVDYYDLDVKIYDYDEKTNTVTDPKYIGFYWNQHGNKFGHPISFHQPREKFIQEFNSVCKWLINGEYMRSKNYKKDNYFAKLV